ncbi:LemA family protein [Mycoplasma sp. 3341]|uniref:LemA family protein n=1 Tax=Mycoplasma sp. 3341 TaxID=3447506 RepID=UPI003F65C23D
MMDGVKSYRNHEAGLLERVTELRSKIADVDKTNNLQEKQAILENVTRGLSLTFEQYPNLKAESLYLQFNTEVALQEDEIYAARRVYNMRVRRFNQEIYVFPWIVLAEKMGLHNLAFFTATEEEIKDVDTSSLL